MKFLKFLSFLCLFSCAVYALEEKNDDQILKNLYQVQTSLSTISNQNTYIEQSLKDNLGQKKYIAKEDLYEKLQRAKKNLLIGNWQTALSEVDENIKNINFQDSAKLFFAYKIQFEANRLLKRYKDSSKICLKMKTLDMTGVKYFNDKLQALCSYTFWQASKKYKNKEFEQDLINWNLSSVEQKQTEYTLKSSIFISLAIRNLYGQGVEALHNLETSLLQYSDSMEEYFKGELVLGLLNYDLGFKEKSLEIINQIKRKIDKRIELKPSLVLERLNLLAGISLARIFYSSGQLQASSDEYEKIANKLDTNIFDNENLNYKKIMIEYAKILYLKKDYYASQKILKNIFDENTKISDGFQMIDDKISRIILANILNRSLENKNQGSDELIELYKIADSDLQYLIENDKRKADNISSMRRKIFPLTILSKEYGSVSKESNYVRETISRLKKVENDIPKNKTNFIHVLNAIEEMENNYYDSIFLKNIIKYKENINKLKNNIIYFDRTMNKLWDEKNPQFTALSSYRSDILARIYALDDINSNENNKIYIEKIKDKKNAISQIRELYKEYLIIKFNIQNYDVKYDYDIINKYEDKIKNLIIYYRNSLFKNNYAPAFSLYLYKKNMVYKNSFKEIIDINKKIIFKNDSTYNKYKFVINNNIKKIKNILSQNDSILKNSFSKIKKNNEEFKNKYEFVFNKLIWNNEKLYLIQDAQLNDLKKIYPIIFKNVFNKIKEFKNKIRLSFSEKDKILTEFSKSKIDIQNEIINNRSKQFQSQLDSYNWGLAR